ncbi:MAG: GNAT family N-acetyltransferase [Clostridia bacterium]|nr:GNAT family N-acetyltransferase [Clostridia bacterium]
MKHKGTQIIETERLILRQIEAKDAEDLCELLNDEKVQEFLSGIPANYTLDMAKDYINNNLSKEYLKKDFYDWAIEEPNTHKLIGRISVYKFDDYRRMANLVWYIIPTVRGKGFITEAAKEVVGFLQNVGFERIEAFANIENIASIKVMEKIGMQYEGTLRKYDCKRDGTLYDAKMYSLIK